MGSPALMNPMNPTGMSQAWNNLGKPVTNNTGTAMPTFGGATTAGVANPYAVSNPAVPTNTGGIISGNPMPATTPVSPTASGGTIPTSGPSSGAGTGNISAPLQNQLNDIFGSGVGGLLSGEIANLGAQNSGYLQSFINAQAPINAQNLATLQTTLGNEGLSANSSAAAIAQSNFQEQIAATDAQLSQQLELQDIQDLLGLTMSLEKPAEQQQAESSPWNIFSKIIGGAGSIINDVSSVVDLNPGGVFGG